MRIHHSQFIEIFHFGCFFMEVGIAHDFIGKMKKTHFAFIAFVPN